LIEMESDRFEFRSEIEISDSDFLTGIDLNLGYGDYQHSESGWEDEAGPDLIMGTPDDERDYHKHATYIRKGIEGRIGFNHEIGDLEGVFGVHGLFDEFKIVGDESILGGLTKPVADANPKITNEDSSRIALFLIEQYDLSEDTTLNAGIRWEQIDRNYEATENIDNDESTFSASGGISKDLNELWNISGNINYSERLPDTAELFSDGAHHATESYEFGERNLGTESAVGFEVVIRKSVGKVTGQFSAFHTKFDDYIFLEDAEQVRDSDGNLADDAGPDLIPGNGDDEFLDPYTEGLPVKNYEAVDAEFQGIEAEIDWLAMENQSWNLILSAYGDVVRGENKSEGGNLPRIPAARLGFGLEVQQENLDFGMKLIRSLKQDRVMVHDDHSEDTTDAYSLLNAFASYDVSLGDAVGELFVKGTNLTDELAYNHASFLKQFAPLPGRSVEIGLKFDF
jgi:iron complex outermembrane receptor protein